MIYRARPGQVRVIDDEGNQLGILEVAEAVELAEERGLDLVEMAAMADPPTCKLMDYGKYKFDQKKKGRGQKKTVQRRKEIKLRPKCEEHDYQVKLTRARDFLEKGHRVQVTMMFRGRESIHVQLGRELLMRLAGEVEELAKIEQLPSREGRNRMVMVFVHK